MGRGTEDKAGRNFLIAGTFVALITVLAFLFASHTPLQATKNVVESKLVQGIKQHTENSLAGKEWLPLGSISGGMDTNPVLRHQPNQQEVLSAQSAPAANPVAAQQSTAIQSPEQLADWSSAKAAIPIGSPAESISGKTIFFADGDKPAIKITTPLNVSTTSSNTVAFDVNKNAVSGYDVNFLSIKIYVDGIESSVFDASEHCSSPRVLFAGTDSSGSEIFESSDAGASWAATSDLPQVYYARDLLWSSDDSRLYVGTMNYFDNSEVFKSSDRGVNWSSVEISDSVQVFCLLEASDGSLFVCTQGGSLVYKSADKGVSWSGSSSGIDAEVSYIFDLVEAADGNLYAASDYNCSVYKSSDGGVSWSNTGSLGCADTYYGVYSLFVDSDGTLYAGTYPDGDVYKSTNGGANWSNTGDLTDAVEVWSLLYVDGNLYAATYPYGEVFKSTNGGASWVNTGDLADADTVYPLLSAGGALYAGTTPYGDVFKSTNGGASWVNTGDLADAYTVYALAAAGNGSYSCSYAETGLSVSKDYNVTVVAADVNGVAADQNTSIFTFTGSQPLDVELVAIDTNPDNQVLPEFDYLKDGNLTVDFNVVDLDSNTLLVDINYSASNVEGTGSVLINDVNTVNLSCADSDFSNSTKCSYDWNIMGVLPGTYYVLVKVSDASNSDFSASDNPVIVVRKPRISLVAPVDGSTSSSRVVSFDVNKNAVSGYDINFSSIRVYVDGVLSADFNASMHCSSPRVLFAGTYPNGDVFKSTNAGATWVNTGDLASATMVYSLLMASDGVLFAGTAPNGDVFKSTDGGTSWSNTADLSGATDATSLLYVAGNLFAGTKPNGDVFKSTNGGTSWSNTADLSGATDARLMYADGNLYAGTGWTNGDVFRSSNAGASWSNTGDLASAAMVYSLFMASDGVLFAGSYPNGDVFKSTNLGVSWSNTADLSNAGAAYSIVRTPDGNLYVSTGWSNGDVFKSSNNGTSWSNTGDLASATEARSLLYVDGALYAGSYPNGDVFKSTNLGVSWSNTGDLSGATYVLSLVVGGRGDYHCSYEESAIASGGDYNVTVAAADLNGVAADQNSSVFTFTGQLPDVNVVAIDANPDNQVLPEFDYLKDGNLTVDFNVMDLDNNSLLVDVNYSASNVEGTGSVLINDVNTVNLSCVDSDFSNSTKCSYDWNIMSVSGGSYYLLVSVFDGVSSDFSASDNPVIVVRKPRISLVAPVDGSTSSSRVVSFDVNKNAVSGYDVNFLSIRVYVDGVLSTDFNVSKHCSSPRVLFAGTRPYGDVFKSTDAGTTWVNSGDLSGVAYVSSLLSVDGVLFAGTSTGTDGDVFRSVDGGATWVNTGDLSGAEEVRDLLYVDGNLFAGTSPNGDVFKSTNGGASWVNSGDLTDAEYVYSLLSVDGNLFAGTGPNNGDVFKSTTGGTTWVNTSDLSGAEYVYSLLSVDGNLFAGTYPGGNVFKSTDGGTSWSNTGDLSGASDVDSLLSVDGVLYAGTYPGGNVFKSTDGGSTWVNSGDLSGASDVYSLLSVDGVLYAGTDYLGSVFKSTNGGTSWVNTGDLADAFAVYALAAAGNGSYSCSYAETGLSVSKDYNVTVVAADLNGVAADQNSSVFTFTGQLPDVNVVAIDSNPDNQALPEFDYLVDGNLTVDFNVMDLDNNSLLVDINYSASSVEGTGSVLINDVNTVNLSCVDSDFSNSTKCSYDWNIMGVLPGTYYVLVKVSDASNSDFSASDNPVIVVRKPRISLVVPVDGSVSASRVVSFDVNKNAVSGYDINSLSIRVYVDGVLSTDFNVSEHCSSNGSYSCSYAETGLSVSKDYNVTVVAADVDGVAADQNTSIFTFIQPPDVNVVAVEGYPDSEVLPVFDYLVDGNLTVDFNVVDLDSNSLLVDVNYSLSNVEGTGSVVINDVNTVDLNCVDSDFSNSTKCSFDWNIMSVLPGAYYLLVSVFDGVSSDFSASDNPVIVVRKPRISLVVPVDGSVSASRVVSFDVNKNAVSGYDINSLSIRVYVDGVLSTDFNASMHCSSPRVLFAGTNPNGDVFKSADWGVTWVNTGDLSGAANVRSLLSINGVLFAGTYPNGDVFKSSNGGMSWVNTAELSGATDAMLMYADGNLYAGTGWTTGNVFRSSNAGASWVNSGALSGTNMVYSLLMAPDGVLFAGTYPNGDVFKSTNGGTSWVNTGDLSNAGAAYSIVRTADGNLYVSTGWTYGDVFKSTNSGVSWSNTGDLASATEARSLLYVDGNLFAGTYPNGDVFKSTNSGVSWSNTGDLSGATYVLSLLSVDGILYAGTGTTNGDVFKSTDNGTSWSNTGDLSGATYVLSLAVGGSGHYHCSYEESAIASGGDYNVTVVAADLNGVAADQNSSVFTYVGAIPPDVNVVAIDGNPDNQLLPIFDYAQDGNLTIDFNVMDVDSNSLIVDVNYSLSNVEGTGSVVINDVNTLDLNCADSDFSNSPKCSYDWNIMSVAVGSYYVLIAVSDGTYSAFSASDNNFVIAQPPTVTITAPADGSRTVSRIISFDVNKNALSGYDINFSSIRVYLDGVESSVFDASEHCASSRVIFAGTSPNGDVFKSVDNGASWVNTGDLTGATEVRSLLVARDGSLFAGTYPSGRVFKSINGGSTWSNTGTLSGANYAYALLEASDGVLYAGVDGSVNVYRSVDGGLSWSSAGLSNQSWAKAIVEGSDGNLYAGTEMYARVFRSSDGSSWSQVSVLGSGLGARNQVFGLLESSGGVLYAATDYGGNVYKSADYGLSWIETGDLSNAGVVYRVVEAVDGNLVAGANASGGDVFRSVDGGSVWVQLAGWSTPAGEVSSVYDLLVGGDGVIYAAPDKGYVFKSVNSGVGWSSGGVLSGTSAVYALAEGTVGSYRCSYRETSVVAPADYNLTVEASDLGGASSSVSSNFTYINNAPDVNVVAIDGSQDSQPFSVFSYQEDGNLTIDFNVIDADATAALTVDINYSTSKREGTGLPIVSGLVLNSSVCRDADFTDLTTCSWDWNTMAFPDRNYHVLLLLSDGKDTAFSATDNNLLLDNTNPETTADYNATWQLGDANLHLSCFDRVGGSCIATGYRKDTDATAARSYGVWQVYDGNIFFNADGNYALDFNSTDLAGNIEDVNTIYILIDRTKPFINILEPKHGSSTRSKIIYFIVDRLAHSDINRSTILVDLNGYASSDFNRLRDCNLSSIGYTCRYTDTNITMGDYNVTIYASDILGNRADQNTTIFSYVPPVAPDVNVVAIDGNPLTRPLPAFSNILDGALTIDFNIMDPDSNSFTLDINYSDSNALATGAAIVADANVNTLTCDDYDFSNSTKCSYSWGIASVRDGNYFLIIEATDDSRRSDWNYSDNNFLIDNTAPTTTSDIQRNVIYNGDVNSFLTCSDGIGSGCLATHYRLDSDSTAVAVYGAWNSYSTNIYIQCAYDCNYGVQFRSIDRKGNSESEKTVYAIIDKSRGMDVNLFSVEGYLLAGSMPTFVYTRDGNLTIDFNVLDTTTNEVYVSIYYHAPAYKPLYVPPDWRALVSNRLISDFSCDDYVFSNTTRCSYDWDIRGFPDTNYVIKVDISDGIGFASEPSKSFRVIGDFTPDINVVAVEGYPISGDLPTFDRRTFGDYLTIDFNIMDPDNNRLTVSLGAGTTSSIFSNVSTPLLSCDDYDFSNSTKCSYEWSIVGVADSNYYLLSTINDGLQYTSPYGLPVHSTPKSMRVVGNYRPLLNIIALDGYDISSPPAFDYLRDNTITIDFNVTDFENDPLDVHIIYGEMLEGEYPTGWTNALTTTPITSLSCNDYNFADSSWCSYSWNFSGLKDALYVISVMAADPYSGAIPGAGFVSAVHIIGNYKPDVNISAIDGYPVAGFLPPFDYRVDDNVTIEFYVSDVENEVNLIELYYSPTHGNYRDSYTYRGTSGVIGGWSRIATTARCDGNNFSNPIHCTADWNITAVDENYYYLMVIAAKSVGNWIAQEGADVTPLMKIVGNRTPDVNFTFIEGRNIAGPLPIFSYDADGNLTIDFNISDAENESLTLSLYYKRTPSYITAWEPITENYSISSLSCADSNFMDATRCSYDWNIMNVKQDQYYLKVVVSDSHKSISRTSPALGIIGNHAPDANLVEIDHYPLTGLPVFHYSTDPIVTIDFNIADFENKIYSVALNYDGAGIVSWSGEEIAAVCDDLNFSDSTHCSYDWNITGIEDRNYLMRITIRDYIGQETQKETPQSFRIIGSSPPQLALLSLDGRAFAGDLPSFDYYADGNITIGMRLSDADNDLNSVSIYYVKEPSGYWRNWIAITENRPISSLDCDGNDFTEATNCYWDWNLIGLADANYNIKAIVTDSRTLSAQGSSPKSFRLIGNYKPVVTIMHIDGHAVALPMPAVFDYLVNGNLAVDFTVMDAENDPLTASLIFYKYWGSEGSYSAIQAGTVFSDVNVLALSCDDYDFSNTTHCHYDWNIAGIVDANYKLWIGVNDGYQESYYWGPGMRIVGNHAPDGNITAIDGYAISGAMPSFAYDADGNLTIDFNLSDADNNPLTVSLYYSTSLVPAVSSWTAIASSKLTSALNCDDSNFADSTHCSYDWNIAGLSNMNYYIAIAVNDGTYTTSRKAQKSFAVTGNYTPDVNIDSVNGHALSGTMPFFNYAEDDNLTIGFSVRDVENETLNASFYYMSISGSSWPTIASQIPISSISCSGSNFSTPKSCTYDWNITGVPDNNYYLRVAVSDPQQTGSATTQKSFRVKGNTPPDINITAIDGHSIAGTIPRFTYSTDGNLTVDFNLSDADNNPLVLSFYYKRALASITSWNAIATLVPASQLNCSSSNFTTPVQCSYEWNIRNKQIPDANYYFKIVVTDSYQTASKTTPLLRIAGNYLPDVNFTAIDGYSALGSLPKFSYVQHGRLSIDFNVMDADDNLLYVDINYSHSTVSDTGSSIIKNRLINTLNCDDYDFSNPTKCSYEWDISRITERQYYLLINVGDGYQKGSNSISVRIAGNERPDVNILSLDDYNVYRELPTFSYLDDPLLTIKFRLKDGDNNSHNISLYRLNSSIGAVVWIPIASLPSSSMNCDSNNFAQPVTCSHDWNITGLADANYYVKIVANDGYQEDSSSTPASVHIIGNYLPDVNVLFVGGYRVEVPFPTFDHRRGSLLTLDFNILDRENRINDVELFYSATPDGPWTRITQLPRTSLVQYCPDYTVSCGDGYCESPESWSSCPSDCRPVCGNAVVEGYEECEQHSDCNAGRICSYCTCLTRVVKEAVYASTGPTYGDVFKSTDSGNTWYNTSDLYGATHVYDLEVTPSGDIYAAAAGIGTGSGAVYKSPNGGNYWQKLALPSTPENPYPTAVTSLLYASDGALYAATLHGEVVKSSDYGSSWANTGKLSGAGRIYDIIENYSGSIIAASDVGGSYRSISGGTSWVPLFTPFESTQALYATDLLRDTILAAGRHSYALPFNLNAIYKSVDSSNAEWLRVADLPVGTYPESIMEGSDGSIYVGTYPEGKIFMSADGNSNWSMVAQLPEQHISALLETSDGNMLAATYPPARIYRSTNMGSGWLPAYTLPNAGLVEKLVEVVEGAALSCPNGICGIGETYWNCPQDCTQAPPLLCGNGRIESGESCESDSDCPSNSFCSSCSCFSALTKPPPAGRTCTCTAIGICSGTRTVVDEDSIKILCCNCTVGYYKINAGPMQVVSAQGDCCFPAPLGSAVSCTTVHGLSCGTASTEASPASWQCNCI